MKPVYVAHSWFQSNLANLHASSVTVSHFSDSLLTLRFFTFAPVINSMAVSFLCLIPSYMGRLHAEYKISGYEINVKDLFLS